MPIGQAHARPESIVFAYPPRCKVVTDSAASIQFELELSRQVSLSFINAEQRIRSELQPTSYVDKIRAPHAHSRGVTFGD